MKFSFSTLTIQERCIGKYYFKVKAIRVFVAENHTLIKLMAIERLPVFIYTTVTVKCTEVTVQTSSWRKYKWPTGHCL